jgi:hypothetical protein
LINFKRPTCRSNSHLVALGLSLLTACSLLLAPQQSTAATVEEDLAKELISISKAIEQWGRFDARNNRKDETVSVRELREFIEPALVRFKYNPEVQECSIYEGPRSSIGCSYDFGESKTWRLGYETWKPSSEREFTREQCQHFAPTVPVGVQCLDAIFDARVVGSLGAGDFGQPEKCVNTISLAQVMKLPVFTRAIKVEFKPVFNLPPAILYNLQMLPNRFTQIVLFQRDQTNCLDNINIRIMRPL